MFGPSSPLRQQQLTERDLIRAVRDARFAERRCCPRCHCDRICRWGTFSGRQRYRCTECRRTFSDLTATPFAYTKRLARWPRYLQLFHEAATVRRCAAALDVHISTAFRWRHKTLDGVRCHVRPALSGIIELTERTYAWSFKGSRNLNGSGRRHGVRVWGVVPLGIVRTRVVTARSRSTATRSENLNVRRPTSDAISGFLDRNIMPEAAVISRFRRGHPYGSALTRHGCRLIAPAAPALTSQDVLRLGSQLHPLLHMTNVEAYVQRFEVWLERFRGVATRYLNNYLAWHELLDCVTGSGRDAASLHRMVSR